MHQLTLNILLSFAQREREVDLTGIFRPRRFLQGGSLSVSAENSIAQLPCSVANCTLSQTCLQADLA